MKRSARRAARAVPPGFEPGAIISRFVQVAPSSYNADTHTVEAVLSVGSRRSFFGIMEELAISADAIDLRRVALGQVPLLDSHDQYELDGILGRVIAASIINGQLVGTLKFAETERGKAAEAMVARGEVTGISVGYSVTTWTIIGVENDIEIWQAQRWELLEASLVSIPADPGAIIRSRTAPPRTQPALAAAVEAPHIAARARMRMRQAALEQAEI